MSATPPRDADAAPLPLPAVGTLFFLSGAAGLVYEVIWARSLSRVLGGSYPAVVAVVAAFLGGLALGAALGGWLAARTRRPLRTYAILEAGIGVYCALFPVLLAVLHPVFGAAYRALGDTPALHAAARLLLAAALLLPPTVAMGATLPVLVRGVVGGRHGVLGGTGLLYGLNTVGAAAGALTGGLVLLPRFGFDGATAVGVVANLAVAAVGFLLDRRVGAIPEATTDAAVDPPPAPAEGPSPAAAGAEDAPCRRRRTVRAVLAAAGAAGFASMLCQMAWTRMIILSFGSSVHAFTLVVTTFILGLGLGGLAAPLLRRSGGDVVPRLAALQAVAALAAWGSVTFLAGLPARVAAFLGGDPVPYETLLLWQAGQVAATVLLPAAAMGACFPAFVAAVAGDAAGAPHAVGRVYACNTAGTIAGTLTGGLLLVPAIGTRNVLLVACVLNLAVAGGLALASLPRPAGPRAAAAALAGMLLVVAGSAPWRLEAIHAGAAVYAGSYAAAARETGRSLDRVFRNRRWDRLHHAEGRSVTVAVTRNPGGDLALLINGKADASSGADMSTQALLGHLPSVLHGAPRSAMVVGLASGVSAAAVERHGVTSLDVAEIAPEVALAERFFRDVNGGVTERPGVRVLLEDGRTHVEHSDRAYDVLVSEPTNPWIAGVSDLFTVEYFRACRERLAPRGIFCAWIQTYSLAMDDIRLLLRTVREVFPDAVVFELTPWSDYGIVASREGDRDLLAEFAARPWPAGGVAAALAEAGLRGPADVLASVYLGREAAAAFAGPATLGLHRDAGLELEFRAPRGVMGDPGYERARWVDLEAVRDADAGPALEGVAALRGAHRDARAGYLAFLAARDAGLRATVVRNLLSNEAAFAAARPHLPGAIRERASGGPASFPLAAADALVRAEAIRALARGIEGGTAFRWALDALAECRLVRGQDELMAGRLAAAEEDFLAAERLRPGEALAPLALAQRARLAAGDDVASPLHREALAHLDRALAANPHCEPALVERAEVFIARHDPAGAERALREALAVRPDSVRALGVFADLRRMQGRRDDARALLDTALALEPNDRGLLRLRDALDRAP